MSSEERDIDLFERVAKYNLYCFLLADTKPPKYKKMVGFNYWKFVHQSGDPAHFPRKYRSLSAKIKFVVEAVEKMREQSGSLHAFIETTNKMIAAYIERKKLVEQEE